MTAPTQHDRHLQMLPLHITDQNLVSILRPFHQHKHQFHGARWLLRHATSNTLLHVLRRMVQNMQNIHAPSATQAIHLAMKTRRLAKPPRPPPSKPLFTTPLMRPKFAMNLRHFMVLRHFLKQRLTLHRHSTRIVFSKHPSTKDLLTINWRQVHMQRGSVM